ncbi:transposase (plasmid) [Sinorhizobium americanum CCGM7]|nr:transposase [Sinorhizobium americanum CCGM7]
MGEEGRSGRRFQPGLPSYVAQMKAVEREGRELRQAKEMMREASAYFAMAELNRPSKR